VFLQGKIRKQNRLGGRVPTKFGVFDIENLPGVPFDFATDCVLLPVGKRGPDYSDATGRRYDDNSDAHFR
jgi:hypothetical protein